MITKLELLLITSGGRIIDGPLSNTSNLHLKNNITSNNLKAYLCHFLKIIYQLIKLIINQSIHK